MIGLFFRENKLLYSQSQLLRLDYFEQKSSNTDTDQIRYIIYHLKRITEKPSPVI